MFLVPCLWGSISTFSGIFFAHIFCYAVRSCVYDHSHPYLVSECLFLAENKAFPYPRRLRAHPRRLRAILWDAAATCSVVFFVVVAEKKRSRNLSVSWWTLYGLVDRLPVSAGCFRRTLQRHFLVDFQKISLERSFPALNEHILLWWIERETAEQRSLEVCRRIDFTIDRRLRPLCSVRGTAASFVNRFSKPRYHWKDLFLL